MRVFLSSLWLALAIAAGCSVVWSARSALGQAFYFQTRYSHSPKVGLSPERPVGELARRRLDLAEQSFRLNPVNFRVCRIATDVAFETCRDIDVKKHDVTLEELRMWCDRGLKLNKYNRHLRYLEAEMIAVESPSKALELWTDYVAWDFWDPFNHYYVVELLARSGRYADAFKEMDFLKGKKYHEDGKRIIRDSWVAEKRRAKAYIRELDR
jgi:hypothetical protein